jgi:hypothetical protein
MSSTLINTFFLASCTGILSITLATVRYQALKAALMNSIKRLGTE